MKILLTGGSGFLGKILMNGLAKSGHDVHTLGRNKNCKFKYDLSKEVPTLLDQYQLIIHAAGKAHTIPKNENESSEFFEVNFKGTQNLCESLSNSLNIDSTFIFISTVAVYGLYQGHMINESNPTNGKTPYAKSKILAENWLKEWSNQNGINLIILRLPLIVGNEAPGNFGAMVDGIRSGKYFSIGKAESKKSVIWAEDLVNLIPYLIKKRGVFNLCDSYHPSFGDLERAISEALNKKEPARIPFFLAHLLAKIGDLLGVNAPINSQKLNKIRSELTFDNSLAKKELGWSPSDILEEIKQKIK